MSSADSAARGGGIFIARAISTAGCLGMMVGLAASAEAVSLPLRVFLLVHGGVFAAICLHAEEANFKVTSD